VQGGRNGRIIHENPTVKPFSQVAVAGGQQKIQANSPRLADDSATAEKCSEMAQNETLAFAPCEPLCAIGRT
jgi:hypothetical protein